MARKSGKWAIQQRELSRENEEIDIFDVGAIIFCQESRHSSTSSLYSYPVSKGWEQ